MVEVIGTSGRIVNVEIKGIAEAMRVIREKGKDIVNDKDAKTAQAANFLQQEIQESIVGNRSEIKSVETGKFANSINVQKIEPFKYSVETDVEYSKYLEYGTIFIQPRMHFRNSLSRSRQKIVTIIKGKF